MPKNIFRNGTKSRESLPLRNEENRNQPPKGLQEETQGICPTATAPNHGNHCRCGARKIETSRQKACRKRRKESARPQRHQITGITAAAERGKSKPAAKRPAGRDARNLPDRNGTESRKSLPLWNEENRNHPPKGLQEETQGICPTATAPNHGNHCRCGTRRIEKRPPKGLLDGNTRIRKQGRYCRNTLQRCTRKAGKRFTFAIGQCRERRYRRCGNGRDSSPPQRCTLKAGKRFTFAIGQCRKHRHRRCGYGQDRTTPQRCTLKAGKRFTFATGQCRKRRYRRCGNGQGRTPLQRCTRKEGKRFTFATGQCRERRHRRCSYGLERTPKQR